MTSNDIFPLLSLQEPLFSEESLYIEKLKLTPNHNIKAMKELALFKVAIYCLMINKFAIMRKPR